MYSNRGELLSSKGDRVRSVQSARSQIGPKSDNNMEGLRPETSNRPFIRNMTRTQSSSRESTVSGAISNNMARPSFMDITTVFRVMTEYMNLRPHPRDYYNLNIPQ